jgi:hypothetical protein
MKEEAGMKLWSPTRAFVGLAAAGLVALLGTTANASDNIYKNIGGLNSDPDATAGITLNPGGSGQVLVGGLIDVRDNDGVQINNFQILNQNTNDKSKPLCEQEDYDEGIAGTGCYDPAGGILAKVRFRAYKESAEVLDFVIALSCGEVWAGNVSLDGTTPVVKSKFPVVVKEGTGINAAFVTDEDFVVTAPAFDPNNGGAAQPFLGIGQGGVADDFDQQRGYIEVFALEPLMCEPDGESGTIGEFIPGVGKLSLDGSVWFRIASVDDELTARNALSGQVFLVKPTVGVSYGYQMDALTRFVIDGGGSIAGSNLFAQEDPNFTNCVNVKPGTSDSMNGTECRGAVSLALSKSFLYGQYDIEAITAGDTKMIVTTPGKHLYCATLGTDVPPFQCQITSPAWDPAGIRLGALGGEEIDCEVYDRMENFFKVEDPEGCGFVSPCEPPPVVPERCYLPYEQTIIGIEPTEELGTGADVQFLTGFLPAGSSGWVELDLTRNLENQTIHSESGGDPSYMSILGITVSGYVGLPATGLVLQTFENGSAGGTYGNAIPMTSHQQILFPGQTS